MACEKGIGVVIGSRSSGGFATTLLDYIVRQIPEILHILSWVGCRGNAVREAIRAIYSLRGSIAVPPDRHIGHKRLRAGGSMLARSRCSALLSRIHDLRAVPLRMLGWHERHDSCEIFLLRCRWNPAETVCNIQLQSQKLLRFQRNEGGYPYRLVVSHWGIIRHVHALMSALRRT
eukprot:5336272-Pleurochrysis_carterae.AAC.2